MPDHHSGERRLTIDDIESLEVAGELSSLEVRLNLLSGFEVMSGSRIVPMSFASQRLLALLAIQGRPVMRNFVAFTLWPDKTEERANGNLRSALWRVRREGLGLIETTGSRLTLGRDVSVDLRVAILVAEGVLKGQRPVHPRPVLELLTLGSLLPDWYDEWIDSERERLRQLRLHALEALCVQLADDGDIPAAIEAGVAAVAAEPRRESSHRALVSAHIAEGNLGEALRQYETYRYMAHTELGVLPSQQMEALIAGIRRSVYRGDR